MSSRLVSIGSAVVVSSWLGLWSYMSATGSTLPSAHPALSYAQHAWPAARAFFLKGEGLPNVAKLTAASFSRANLEAWYKGTDPLVSGLCATFWISVVSFVLGEVTGNLSQIDRIWTFAPVWFSIHFTVWPYVVGGATSAAFRAANKLDGIDARIPLPAEIDRRMALVLALQLAWSARLSFNGWRRGFFSSFFSEDYRWPIIRNYIYRTFPVPRLVMFWFNLIVIAFFQAYLLFASSMVQYLLLTTSRVYHPTYAHVPLGLPDAAIAGLFVATLVVEMIADNQQQAYQRFKHNPNWNSGKRSTKQVAREEAARKRGFVTSGLWAMSRHPNFLCEQATWWILWLYTIRATLPAAVAQTLSTTFLSAFEARDVQGMRAVAKASWPYVINWALVTPVSMSMLFYFSTLITEAISSGKYPLYKSYQKRVAMFLPLETLLYKIPLNLVLGRKGKLDREVFGIPDAPSTDRKKVQ